MIKFSNIVQKSINEQSSSSSKFSNQSQKPTKSKVLAQLFSETEVVETGKKEVKFSNKLGDIFGVENPRNL